ncbi:hypothetical protein ACSCBZ_11765 [Streptomyces niveiscabiei]
MRGRSVEEAVAGCRMVLEGLFAAGVLADDGGVVVVPRRRVSRR